MSFSPRCPAGRVRTAGRRCRTTGCTRQETLRPVASTPCDRSQRRPPVHGVADIRSAAITYPNLRHCCRRRRYCPTSVFRFSSTYFYLSERLSKKNSVILC
ncbi:unnamed protein product [Aphis gossypii]|uniref:Uncharacterized protein n=1 Tax=Aphis gossypii TaxID=80765 RepID=A0A9P0JC02_APHGO|nr:unnamed protein product [Aphis gossypii]